MATTDDSANGLDELLALVLERQEGILTELYGALSPTPVDPDRRLGGLIRKVNDTHTIVQRIEATTIEIASNGTKREPWPTAVKVAVVSACGVVGAAGVAALAQILT